MSERTAATASGSRERLSPTKIVRAASPVVPNMASAAPLDGVLQLDAVHKDLVHESFTCDTRDHEDHTCARSHSVPPPARLLRRAAWLARPRRFCGMMFDVQAETGLPMEYVEVSSLSVGGLCIIDHACPPWPQRPVGPPGFPDGERAHLITPEASRPSRSPRRRAGPPVSKGSHKTPSR